MKKLITKLNMAIIGIMFAVPAMAAEKTLTFDICPLLEKFKPVFGLFRTVAFVGAGITIATWAWKYISEANFEAKTEGKKGFSMLVGVIILFALGGIMQAFVNMTGTGGACDMNKIFG